MDRWQRIALGLLGINGVMGWIGTQVLIHPDHLQPLGQWFASETYESATHFNQADRY
jgi:hypothetical protein